MRTVVVAFAALALTAGCRAEPEFSRADLKPNDWLLRAEDDEARFLLIQQQFRGFDQPMWEVGERFSRMHEALTRGNPELAAYHWEKIRTTIENGVAKRPGRRANAEQFLLNGLWAEVNADLTSNDIGRAWRGFERATAACKGCHQAEQVPYMNNQPIFDLSVPPGSAQ